MNERIRQLAEQAGFIDRGTNHTAYMNFDHENFAQLIVRECADIAAKNQAENMNWDIAEIIKEHFGVEE